MEDSLEYIVNHVFLPPKLPQQSDESDDENHALANSVYEIAEDYCHGLPTHHQKQWQPILEMIRKFRSSHRRSVLNNERIQESMAEMRPGDVFALLIRAQNAGVIIRKYEKKTVFSSFEVSAPCAAVMGAKGKLLCSYPGPAIEVPMAVVEESSFRKELASFLVQMNVDVLDSAATTTKAGSTVVEERDVAHPRYITQLLTGILHGMGEAAEVIRIQKRIADDVLWEDAFKPWRRAPIWLVLRVALQTSLFEVTGEHSEYKAFIVFFMAKILMRAVDAQFSSDLVFCMRAKICRRLYKLGSYAPEFVTQAVSDVGAAAENFLQARWSDVQKAQEKRAIEPAWHPERLDILTDTRLSLSNSRRYLTKVMEGGASSRQSTTFNPGHSHRLHGIENFDGNLLTEVLANDNYLALGDFEVAVQDHLEEWVDQDLTSTARCEMLSQCINEYSKISLKAYANNPEELSLMLLTLFSLWTALDRMAVAQCQLLRDYSPEVPIHLLHSLLLRRSPSFKQLRAIEGHLRARYDRATTGRSVFSDDISPQSFAVRYFETSYHHQELKARIEADAAAARREKVSELEDYNIRHKQLQEEACSVEHEYGINRHGYRFHYRSCEKCRLQKKASELCIGVHEWPLSRNFRTAAAAVFELDSPKVFRIWRTATYFLLHDICTPPHARPSNSEYPAMELNHYDALSSYRSGDTLRIILASTTKSFAEQTHYKSIPIPSTKTSVCVNNGLTFRLYDRKDGVWASEPFQACSVAHLCTFQLPSNSPYGVLQYAIDGTSHTSNEVIASQSDCPLFLTLHEFIAFASLRSGPRLQWLNIMRELATRSLSFLTEEVHLLLIQAAWQIGPLSDNCNREWHEELEGRNFGLALLKVLGGLMHSIKENWLDMITMRSIILLTSRLLSSTKEFTVREEGCQLLRSARQASYAWVRQLVKKLQDSVEEYLIKEFQIRLRETATVCRETYDVDLDLAPRLLETSQDIAIFLELGIIIHDNTPPDASTLPMHYKRSLDRNRRLARLLEPVLKSRLQVDQSGLDKAVCSVWDTYRSGSAWECLEVPNDRWFVTTTVSQAGLAGSAVQMNVLDGRLLINGNPLGRLPPSILRHPTYLRILGQQVLDVIPSDIADMEYATRAKIFGYQLYFSLREDGLVIRTKRMDQYPEIIEFLELIPHDKFTGDLPTLFVDSFSHWLNLHDGELELRPRETPWTSSLCNWRMKNSLSTDSMMIQKIEASDRVLVDIRSTTFKMIATQLESLEYNELTVVTCSRTGDSVLADLPRLKLSFSLDQERYLQSRNWPGLVVDENQSAGALFGLSSQLILRARDALLATLPRSRRVIIPYGEVEVDCSSSHVTIMVNTKQLKDVKFFEYQIDNDLGRLSGARTLASKLYKSYIHALTSHCLPDPLTGRTGTEESLLELRSAGCRSFQTLGTDEVQLLMKIHSLSPQRRFYPVHKKVMQTVQWSVISPLAQHPKFYEAVEAVIEYAGLLSIFSPDSDSSSNLTASRRSEGEKFLLERSAGRTAIYYAEDLVLASSQQSPDTIHVSADEEMQSEARVSKISRLAYDQPSSLSTLPKIMDTLRSWRHLSGEGEDLRLSYSRVWLKLDLSRLWISLYNLCRRRGGNKFQLVFSLSALVCGSPETLDVIPTILAFAINPQFHHLSPPSWPAYNLAEGFEPKSEVLKSIIFEHAISFESSQFAAYLGESDAALRTRRYTSYMTRRDSEADQLLSHFIHQWPCQTLVPLSSIRTQWLFDMPKLMKSANELFLAIFQNMQLRNHVKDVQTLLDEIRLPDVPTTNVPFYGFLRCSQSQPPICSSRVTLEWLFINRMVPTTRQLPQSPGMAPVSRLQNLISRFRDNSANGFHHLYGEALETSRKSFGDDGLAFIASNSPSLETSVWEDYRDRCHQYLLSVESSIRASLSPSNSLEKALFTGGLWPRITTSSLLSSLASTCQRPVSRPWQEMLATFALAFLLFQRSQRLLFFGYNNGHGEFFRELNDIGTVDILVKQQPDWLLVQIENDFLARPLQIQVAQEMISPSSGRNTAMQLNMGEGKSSVIVPLVAATVADGEKLARVVVLKSLASQMFQLLVERLGGLVNRQIFFMPFSRSVRPGTREMQVIQNLYEQCMHTRGILVVQPEHILSFKLMGIERLINSASNSTAGLGLSLLQSQRWLQMHSRDILDESDEILHVRYQLIYTVGEQKALDHHPDRWEIIHGVLALVKKHAGNIGQQYPFGIEVGEQNSGQFPHVRLLHDDAASALTTLVAEDILHGALPNYPLGLLDAREREAASQFVTQMSSPEAKALAIDEQLKNNGMWKTLLLLRGLFAHGVLIFVLQAKRWRVDYGLDLTRSLLAVPFRAKDVPALRAEFGHPDVAILLTYLSYYYDGLSQDQMDQCFQLLYKLDNPSLEYEKWVLGNSAIPEPQCHLSNVNVQDLEQRKILFRLLRHNCATVNFFLSQVAFPKQAKEFPHKLSTSGWDIAEVKTNLTTGFSGTNDNQYLLPTSFIQADPVNQVGTNAKVLSFLLQPENGEYLCFQRDGESISAKKFIGILVKQLPDIRVLLDVGAQMLEMGNAELCDYWLKQRPDIPAAVFFGDGDQLVVRSRTGTTEALVSSPFRQQLGECLIYLDDAHTRGTDLKLPRHYRAAVTLGPKVTKDRLLQGCMRMRKLGHGQSVMFFAPIEVDRKIRTAANKSNTEAVKSADILLWAMLETCAEIQHNVPQWAQQGLDYRRRALAWTALVPSNDASVERLKSSWLQDEARPLETMYGDQRSNDGLSDLQTVVFDIPEVADRCNMLAVRSLSNVQMEEEQEREVDHEVELERQVERPPKMTAATHEIETDVRQFVQNGSIPPDSEAFQSLFLPLSKIMVEYRDSHAWLSTLLATRDFSRTIQSQLPYSADFLRPVHWVVSSNKESLFVVLSPFEVDGLLQEIRQSSNVHLHIYAPRVTQIMTSFEDLKFYCIPSPPWWDSPGMDLKIQLNLWAGQLYLTNKETYMQLCKFLGLYTQEHVSMGNIVIESDGFIRPEHRRSTSILGGGSSPFTESPVHSLRQLISLRRKGMSWDSTHMGKILHAGLLGPEQFDSDTN